MYNVSIPKISDEELKARYERIKPIVTIDGTKFFMREYAFEELSKLSFYFLRHQDKRQIVDTKKYEPLKSYDFECLHAYGHSACFSPSIAEILAQIDPKMIPRVDAFEIIESPQTSVDFSRNQNAFNAGFHSSTVRLYMSKDNPICKKC